MMPPGSLLPTATLALGAAFVFIAFVVRGFTGFGAALVAIPLLALVLDFKVVVLVISVLSIINGIAMTLGVRGECDTREIGPLLGGFVVGMAVGIGALLHLPGPVLKRIFGLFVAAFALRLLLTPSEATEKRWPRWGGWVAGVFSGLTGGMFGASGPPAILYLYRRLESTQVLRATVIVYFLAGDVARMFTYTAAGAITIPVLWASLWFVPASFVGTWVGTWLQQRATPGLFRRCVAATLVITGALFAVGK